MNNYQKYEIVLDENLHLLENRNYRVLDQSGNWIVDTATGRAAFTLKQASEFIYRLAIKEVMENYLKGEQKH